MEEKKEGPKRPSAAGAASAYGAPFINKGESPQRPLFKDVTKQEEEQKLIAILKSDGPGFDKDVACRRLAVIATQEAVPALAALLADEGLCDSARYALEAIPDPSVDTELRAAMAKLKGRLLIGVINSIGIRRDARAVDALVKRLGDADAGVAAAAAAALGKIAGPNATNALVQALAGDPAVVRPAVGDALLAIADALLAAGKRDEAAAMFDKVRGAQVPKPLALGATRGAILARQSDGVPLLVEQFKSGDWDVLDMALRLVREMPESDVTRALADPTLVSGLSPEKRILLLRALGDRRDAAALPTVLEAARSGDAKVRVAALQAVAQIGDATAIPALFGNALDPDAVVAAAAQASLVGIPNTNAKVNDAVIARIADKDPKVRRVAIETVGKRQTLAAVAPLVKAADDSDAQIRVVVLKALTEIALVHRGEAAAKSEAKKAALALADKLAQSNPTEAAEAKKKLTEPLVKDGPVPMTSPGL